MAQGRKVKKSFPGPKIQKNYFLVICLSRDKDFLLRTPGIRPTAHFAAQTPTRPLDHAYKLTILQG